MAVTYFKRYRMELRLDRMVACQPERALPEGFRLVPWSTETLNLHADVKFESFRNEIDAHVFPCLADQTGCRELMREIAGRRDFLPEATWLLVCDAPHHGRTLQACGTIQGLRSSPCEGAIQNLGVHPSYRDQGLGSHLLCMPWRAFAKPAAASSIWKSLSRMPTPFGSISAWAFAASRRYSKLPTYNTPDAVIDHWLPTLASSRLLMENLTEDYEPLRR